MLAPHDAIAGSGRQAIIGTAGWSVPREVGGALASTGTGLERYASGLNGVEVNSSFYRRHRPSTWQRWHDAVGPGFRFAVKLPKIITHELRLAGAEPELDLFFADIAPLGGKLGPVLVQLPPFLAFDAVRDGRFFEQLRQRCPGTIVLEPRHVSWAAPEAGALLQQFGIGRVYADPQDVLLRAAVDLSGFVYLRLHGAPQVYYSSYSAAELAAFGRLLHAAAAGSWCIFDNTASGAALRNALTLQSSLADGPDRLAQ